jgi:hypothetical protein
LLAILAHDHRRGFQANADRAALVDEGALGGNSFDNILAVKIDGIPRPSDVPSPVLP